MIYTGYIQDDQGAPLVGQYWPVTADGVDIGSSPSTTEADGSFAIELNPGEFLNVSVPGYKPAVFSGDDIYRSAGLLTVHKSFPVWAVAAVVGAVVLWRGRSGKVGKLSTQDVIPIFYIVGGVIALSMVTKILQSLGIWDSRDTRDLDNAAQNPASFWNPGYWMNTQDYTYTIDMDTASQWAKEIYDSFGFFNDCEECVLAVFRRMRTKANASFLAYVFQQIYNMDLLSFLRGGMWPQDRLSDADVAVINNFVNKLPNY